MEQKNKKILTLCFLVVLLFIMLLASNWSRILYMWHNLQWNISPSRTTGEQLLKDKINVEIQDMVKKDPKEMERALNLSRKITVFFKTDTSISKVNIITDEVIATGKVEDAKYISQDEALKLYKEMNKNDTVLLNMLTPDILPSSLDILVKDKKYVSEIIKLLQQYNNDIDTIIDNVKMGKQIENFLQANP